MQIYITHLEYKGEQIRGIYHYKIEGHFGLNSDDINHPDLKSSFDIRHPMHSSKEIGDEVLKKYELLEGFRSWYILQHFKKEGFGFKPFTTQMSFSLT